MKRTAFALSICVVVASCAQPPSNISPISMPSNAYRSETCDQLAAERRSVNADLEDNSAKQRNAVAGDAFGVFMIGVPMSSLTGNDKKPEIATDKGKLIAIDDTMRAKGCTRSPS